MFTIGEFARLGEVTARTLRHYDDIGILHPAEVDRSSGYRRYRASQLPALNRIAALQRLGFSLIEIREMISTVTADQLREMLALRQLQLATEIDEHQAALRDVESRLRAIDREGHMPAVDITIKRLPAVRFAAVTTPVPGFGPANTQTPLTWAAEQLTEAMTASRVEPAGPWFICFDRPDEDSIRGYFCVPVLDEVTLIGAPAALYELDAIERAASVTQAFDDINDYRPVYTDLAIWAEANGYQLVGDGRDVSLDGHGPESGFVLEAQWPLGKSSEDRLLTPRPL